MTWTTQSRDLSLIARRAARRAARAKRRKAQGLPYQDIEGAGRPRRARDGEYMPRDLSALDVATLEIEFDLDHDLHCPAQFMSRTHYRLRADEFAIYTREWREIRARLQGEALDRALDALPAPGL